MKSIGDAKGKHAARTSKGVTKFATTLSGGAVIESVVVPMRTLEKGRERLTLCISTQAGCRMGCAFCATGRAGFKRDLSPEEIAGQTVSAAELGLTPDRLVFMGMGEPLDNFESWAEAVRILAGERSGPRPGRTFSRADMLVSTCGLVPGIRALAALRWPKLVPAVSLNAPNDEIRSRIMPVNRRHSMADLREALSSLPLKRGVLMIEYVVFRGLNDLPGHAEELAGYLEPFRPCVNLIAYNRVEGAGDFESPTAAEVERFKRTLNSLGVYARRRVSKGASIGAGCGQLRGGIE